MVASLQEELQKLEPVLKEKSAETELLLIQVARDTEEADHVCIVTHGSHSTSHKHRFELKSRWRKQKSVGRLRKSLLCKQMRRSTTCLSIFGSPTQLVVRLLQRDLDRALPALQAADRALSALTKAEVTEVNVDL